MTNLLPHLVAGEPNRRIRAPASGVGARFQSSIASPLGKQRTIFCTLCAAPGDAAAAGQQGCGRRLATKTMHARLHKKPRPTGIAEETRKILNQIFGHLEFYVMCRQLAGAFALFVCFYIKLKRSI
jgi:hypothetical protein